MKSKNKNKNPNQIHNQIQCQSNYKFLKKKTEQINFVSMIIISNSIDLDYSIDSIMMNRVVF